MLKTTRLRAHRAAKPLLKRASQAFLKSVYVAHAQEEEKTSELRSAPVSPFLPPSHGSIQHHHRIYSETHFNDRAETSLSLKPQYLMDTRFSASASSLGDLADWSKFELDLTVNIGRLVIQHSTNWISSGKLAFLDIMRLNQSCLCILCCIDAPVVFFPQVTPPRHCETDVGRHMASRQLFPHSKNCRLNSWFRFLF